MSRAADYLAKFAFLLLGMAILKYNISLLAVGLLVLAWLIDGGHNKIKHSVRDLIQEPFILAMIMLCLLVAAGLLWGNNYYEGWKFLRRYLTFLIFIPYLLMLNHNRLPWAIAGALLGFLFIVAVGVYHVLILDDQYSKPFGLHYVVISLTFGIGVLCFTYAANITESKPTRIILWMAALFLMFLQFNIDGRTPLIATLVSLFLMMFMFYKENLRQLIPVFASLLLAIGIFTASSDVIVNRAGAAVSDIELIQQGKFNTSIGYRLANLDVALDGMMKHPITGIGTGQTAKYFDNQIITYKDGIYKDLPRYYDRYKYHFHYHNDWADIGLNSGIPGIIAFALVLLCWYRTLYNNGLPIIAASMICYVFLLGLTDVLVLERPVFLLLLMITGIAITLQKTNNNIHEIRT